MNVTKTVKDIMTSKLETMRLSETAKDTGKENVRKECKFTYSR